MSYYVYIHICPNGKRYIGTTSRTVDERWRSNGIGYYANKHFYSAIKKYGWDNIVHIVMEVKSQSLMYFWEIVLINKYQTNNPKYGYNKSTGGEKSSFGYKFTEEAKRKLSERMKGCTWNIGKKASLETRKKMSESHKGKNTWMKGRVAWNKGLKTGSRSEEVKKKISETRKNGGYKPSEETRLKMSIAAKNRKRKGI